MVNVRWIRDFASAAPVLEAAFEPSSMESVRDGLDTSTQNMHEWPAIDWASHRRVLSELECKPSRTAMSWLRGLSVELQPVQLMRCHARIANLLHQRWDQPELALRLIERLLVDDRGGRHGFAAAVVIELRALAEHLAWRAQDQSD